MRMSWVGRTPTVSCALAALVFGISDPVLATGFFVNQQSVRGLARGSAGNAAAADNLGTIFFNPAGLLLTLSEAPVPGATQASIGAHLIVPRSRIRDSGSAAASPGTLGAVVPYAGGDARNPTDPTPIPNVYIARALLDGKAAVALGVNAPFGLETKFSSDWFGRYDAIQASLRTINIGLVGAYAVDKRLTIGGGLDMQYARTELVTAIPNPLTPGGPTAATDGRVHTKGDDWTPGYNVGLLFKLTDDTRIGIHYRAAMHHDIEGKTEISRLGGPLAALNGTVGARSRLKLPDIASIGLRTRLTQNLELLAGIDWLGWSDFDEIRIRFADGSPDAIRPTRYRDTFAFSLAAEYRISNEWSARGGIRYDETPTVGRFRDTIVPDSERLWLAFGATYKAGRNVVIDFAFNHVFFRNTDVGVTRTFFDGTPLATAASINGSVKSVVNTVSIDFRFGF